jgi:predicted phage-related endonuclease
MSQPSSGSISSVARRHFIGGSDARIIMGNDEVSLLHLWQEKRGEVEPLDLSGNLIVQLGVVTEHLNRQWFECNTGLAIKDVQRRVNHPVVKWMAATLDGVVDATGAVFEAKFMLPWSFSEEGAAEKYMPQLQHNMWVTNATPRHSRSSRAAANGSRSRSRPIRFTSTSCSPPRRSSGAALRAVNSLVYSASSRRGHASRLFGSLI